MNNIKNIIESTKGLNYNFDMKDWKKMDFSLIYENIKNNCDSLSIFLYSEKDNEKEYFDIFLKDTIKLNFNNLLKNIMLTYSNVFFERIIKYNENFKITSLYNTLKYIMISTLAYYRSLYGSSGKIKALTKDIKLKIYSLNVLDKIAQKKNNEVLNLLNKNVKEFIIDSKDYFAEKYIELFESDVSIEKSFTEIVRQEILDNVIELKDVFKDDFLSIMNEYFEDKLITIYTKTLNEETKNFVAFVEELREGLKANIDDIFSLEPDEVLNDINNKMSTTLASLDKYNNNSNTFKISENLENFLYNYGSDNIQPKFTRILNIFNEAAKNGIEDTVEKNADNYINYHSIEEFSEIADNIHKNIYQNYFGKINQSIYNYGIEEYPKKLENEISRQAELYEKKNRRILSEEEIENIKKEKIADKTIDEALKKILLSSLSAKTFINSFGKFDEFEKTIDENLIKLNISYKQALKIIKDNNYPEEIYNNLTSIITKLKNSTLDYYNSIKLTYNELKNYLKESINRINKDLNKCANRTYIIFGQKYENYTNMKNIGSINNENIGDISGSEIIENQAKITTVNYTISNIQKDTQFIFKVDYEEGEIIKQIVKAKIINKSKPGILKLTFINEREDEGDVIERIEAEFKNVNFTMDMFLTTGSKILNVTTSANFESFNYYKDLIQLIPEEKDVCEYIEIFGFEYKYCYTVLHYSEDNYKELEAKKEITVESKNAVDKGFVPENMIFEL